MNLTIKEAKRLLNKKEISATELTKKFLEKIKQKEELNAFINIVEDHALKMASESDKRIKEGSARSLEGIPIGVKDLFCTKNIITTAASKILSNFKPPYESTVTQKLWDNGAILLGKLNMDEFAMGSTTTDSYFGPTLNPWRKKSKPSQPLVPGGSSGASAAAVSAGLCLSALGSDTGGSIRQPASFCGIVGIRPTYGLCSRFGMIAYASSLDQAGCFGKTVEDTATVFEAIAGYDPNDAQSLNVPVPNYTDKLNPNMKNLRIAVFEDFFKGLNEEGQELLKKGIKLFEEAGAKVDIIKFPILDYMLSVYYIIATAEASSNLARYDGVRFGLRVDAPSIDEMYCLTRAQGFGEEVKRRIMIGTYVLSSGHQEAYYLKAKKVRQLIIQEFEKVFKDYDIVLSPTSPTPAFPIDEKPTCPQILYLVDIYTVPVNLAKLPAISVPVGLSQDGLPMGLQIIGPRFSEQTLFNTAQFVEESVNFPKEPLC